MKAIVSVTRVSRGISESGVSVHLIGCGADERAARLAAYEFVNHGHNPFDEEYQGGELVTVAPELEALFIAEARDGWQDTYDEDGQLVESDATDTHMRLLSALSQLCLTPRGELSSRALGATQEPLTVQP